VYDVTNARNGYGGSTTSKKEEKVLDVIGERNVHGVRRMDTISVLAKDYDMYG
jgi:hypothetical protein